MDFNFKMYFHNFFFKSSVSCLCFSDHYQVFCKKLMAPELISWLQPRLFSWIDWFPLLLILISLWLLCLLRICFLCLRSYCCFLPSSHPSSLPLSPRSSVTLYDFRQSSDSTLAAIHHWFSAFCSMSSSLHVHPSVPTSPPCPYLTTSLFSFFLLCHSSLPLFNPSIPC